MLLDGLDFHPGVAPPRSHEYSCLPMFDDNVTCTSSVGIGSLNPGWHGPVCALAVAAIF